MVCFTSIDDVFGLKVSYFSPEKVSDIKNREKQMLFPVTICEPESKSGLR
jgi:hypothetical protein